MAETNIKHFFFLNPIGERLASCLFTRVTKDLNAGLPLENRSSGRSGDLNPVRLYCKSTPLITRPRSSGNREV